VELLKARMASIQRSQLELSLDVQQQTDISRVYMSSINALKPELKRLSKRRDQLKKYWTIPLYIKPSPYSIGERTVPELIPVLGSQT